jgi:transposase
MARKPYPSDVKDDEWEFVAPYLALIREDSPQREHDLREIDNALRWVLRAGAPWRIIPNDLPLRAAVYQQVQLERARNEDCGDLPEQCDVEAVSRAW